jgi:hypothetical protein
MVGVTAILAQLGGRNAVKKQPLARKMLPKRKGKFALRRHPGRKATMNYRIRRFSAAIAILFVFLFITGTADAQRRNERDVRDALRSLNSKIDDLEYNLRYQMQSTSSPNSRISNVMDDVRDLRDATKDFEDNLYKRRENGEDVERIVAAAQQIEQFLRSNPQNRRVTDDWDGVKRQIERLGANYGVTARWDNGPVEEEPPYAMDPQPVPAPKVGRTQPVGQTVGLSGAYELDRARSESVDDIITNTSLGNSQREDLKSKLEAPQQISLDIRGSQVTLATSNASPVSFVADGREKTERDSSGKTIRVRATVTGNDLVISSLGGETDYTITFTSLSNGQSMKVQRRITTDYMNQTVIAESVYNKTDSVAQLGVNTGGNVSPDPNGGYSDNDNSGTITNGGVPSRPGAPRATYPPSGNYTVPNGVILTGVLENEINTKVSQNNDRFRLTVQSPNEFRGAVIEGYVSGVGRSGKISGQSNITFNFERITLRNGQSYDFAGYLQSIKDQYGKTVRVDNEGTARGDSQTRETVKRSGAGAAIGALIGAIAGGGKGAAIGAVIGGGAGAGSVVVQGKDDIRLMPGSTITVQSSSPGQTYSR